MGPFRSGATPADIEANPVSWNGEPFREQHPLSHYFPHSFYMPLCVQRRVSFFLLMFVEQMQQVLIVFIFGVYKRCASTSFLCFCLLVVFWAMFSRTGVFFTMSSEIALVPAEANGLPG